MMTPMEMEKLVQPVKEPTTPTDDAPSVSPTSSMNSFSPDTPVYPTTTSSTSRLLEQHTEATEGEQEQHNALMHPVYSAALPAYTGIVAPPTSTCPEIRHNIEAAAGDQQPQHHRHASSPPKMFLTSTSDLSSKHEQDDDAFFLEEKVDRVNTLTSQLCLDDQHNQAAAATISRPHQEGLQMQPCTSDLSKHEEDDAFFVEDHDGVNDLTSQLHHPHEGSKRLLPNQATAAAVAAASDLSKQEEDDDHFFMEELDRFSTQLLPPPPVVEQDHPTKKQEAAIARTETVSQRQARTETISRRQEGLQLQPQTSTVSDRPPPGFYNRNLKHDEPREQKFFITTVLTKLSRNIQKQQQVDATWIGFWALLGVTCANYMLAPMRDAVALAVGVKHMPTLTLASTGLAVVSSVPIGWLFEAPDPKRRKLWKRLGLTRGETQGTSLALFYRFFALTLLLYAIGFQWARMGSGVLFSNNNNQDNILSKAVSMVFHSSLGQLMYVAFFLVVHLMKLHSLSLIWGVTTEAMEYEECAQKRRSTTTASFVAQPPKTTRTRLQRLAFVGFGGTLGGILGSIIASTLAQYVDMSGLLVVAAILLEASAELAIELGRVMQKHWEEEKHFKSTDDLTSLLDTSMKRSTSLGSMKRVASGNSLAASNGMMMRSKSTHTNLSDMNSTTSLTTSSNNGNKNSSMTIEEQMNDNSFTQRLLRGITTILRSRLLMAVFTYNALYASTSVLLSFQRAELVANRNEHHNTTTAQNTAFLAKINMASSVAVFALQASGMGAMIAHRCGPRGTLALIPLIRLLGVLALAWWHVHADGKPPNLIIFLMLDECTRVINFAVAKPVRESLWRGLSNEARYEAKPIVDTLANRWGGGSAAFLVSLMDKAVVYTSKFGTVREDGSRSLLGFTPNLLLCIIVAVWWACVSADLGHIRRRIDLELKKHQ